MRLQVAGAVVALLGGTALADPPPEIDDASAPSYTPVQHVRKGLVVGGALLLTGVYATGAGLATLGQQDLGCCGHNRLWPLWIPVAGPFIELGMIHGFSTDDNEARLALVAGASYQIAGLVMMYLGVTRKETVYIRSDLVGNVAVTPMAGNGASGFALAGSF